MKLYSVLSNAYRLDGGAMFGNAPKQVWEKWLPADDRNQISLATRAFLAVTSHAVVLFDAGIGAYMEPKFRERYKVEGHWQRLLTSLDERGYAHTDVTDVIISHLHFDHAGGLLSAWEEGRPPELLFPHARYYVSDAAWERAVHPHVRDRASFITPLNELLEESGRLVRLGVEARLGFDELDVRFIRSDGHTPGLLCPDLRWDQQRAVFASDLVPGRAWVHLPITMGYDRYPELLISEKNGLLTSIAEDHAWLCYVHDPEMAMSKIQFDPEHNTFIPVESVAECVL
ncbi:MAG TPA: MBL fold metallo-hydrolase [Bacteroidota bacterium]|nr:MBL fold metallo-hydrolase [Bacteroidota bacterium]